MDDVPQTPDAPGEEGTRDHQSVVGGGGWQYVGWGTGLFVELNVFVGTPRVSCWGHVLGEVGRTKARWWKALRRTLCLHNPLL